MLKERLSLVAKSPRLACGWSAQYTKRLSCYYVPPGSPRACEELRSPRETVELSPPRESVELTPPQESLELSPPRESVELSPPWEFVKLSPPRESVELSPPRESDERPADKDMINIKLRANTTLSCTWEFFVVFIERNTSYSGHARQKTSMANDTLLIAAINLFMGRK
jgi:hypothetical protein